MNDEMNWSDLFGFILRFTALKNTYLFGYIGSLFQHVGLAALQHVGS